MKDIIESVRKQLKQNSDLKTKESGMRFFKEDVMLYGVKTATVTKIGKDILKEIKTQGKQEIFALCETLWKSGYMEESFIACNWAYSFNKNFEVSDFSIFEGWVSEYVSNWASCDTLCNHTIGTFIDKFPDHIKYLKRWAKSKNHWNRRASAVSLIVPAKEGKFLSDIFEISDILLLDKEDLVQKGYGWLLKAACNKHEKEVFDYVIRNRETMPRTALRYAIEKMPDKLKKEAMKK